VRIDILSLFPEMFDGFFNHSIVGRARERGLVDIILHNFRMYTEDSHHVVDDYPYGGGSGMVLKPEPIFNAVEAIAMSKDSTAISTVLLSPQGRLLTQEIAQQLAGNQQLILICGHYEGVDERVGAYLADDEISIGDYVLSGGEVAAMVVADCVVRLLPEVLGSAESLEDESHINGLLEYPQYTRPSIFRGWSVPSVLLSGNHAEIASWRRKQSLIRTGKRRPDLIRKAKLTREDKMLLKEALAQNTNN
jgi:tRNA (guanine37-N1)-methyltransferase